jgi:hypothetical protein
MTFVAIFQSEAAGEPLTEARTEAVTECLKKHWNFPLAVDRVNLSAEPDPPADEIDDQRGDCEVNEHWRRLLCL